MRSFSARALGALLLSVAGLAVGEVASSAIDLGCLLCYGSLGGVTHTSFAMASCVAVILAASVFARKGQLVVQTQDRQVTAAQVLALQVPGFVVLQLLHGLSGQPLSVSRLVLHLGVQILAAHLLTGSTLAIAKAVRIRRRPGIPGRSRDTISALASANPPPREPVLLDRPLRAPPLAVASTW